MAIDKKEIPTFVGKYLHHKGLDVLKENMKRKYELMNEKQSKLMTDLYAENSVIYTEIVVGILNELNMDINSFAIYIRKQGRDVRVTVKGDQLLCDTIVNTKGKLSIKTVPLELRKYDFQEIIDKIKKNIQYEFEQFEIHSKNDHLKELEAIKTS